MAVAAATLAGGPWAARDALANDAPEYCPSAEDVRYGELNAEPRPRFGDFDFKTEEAAQIYEQVARFEEVIVAFNEPNEDGLPTSVDITCIYRTKLKGADEEWIYLEVVAEPVSELEYVAVSLGLVSYPLTSKYYSRACDCYEYICRKRRYRCPF